MDLPSSSRPGRLPHQFPVGTTYVVEGYAGKEGHLRVISRYVVLPGGRRINVPSGPVPSAPSRAIACWRDPNLKQSHAKSRPRRARKKFAAYSGTERLRKS